jgi:hypothetical protein
VCALQRNKWRKIYVTGIPCNLQKHKKRGYVLRLGNNRNKDIYNGTNEVKMNGANILKQIAKIVLFCF